MTQPTEPLAPFLAEPSRNGAEISVTGKWVPIKPGGLFRKSAESKDMLDEWEDIHAGAKADSGVLSTEINHAVGEDAVLVHHVFENADALVHYFSTTATDHMAALTAVAKPEIHLVRGTHIPAAVKEAVTAKGVPAAFGELLFGFVRNDYQQPDPTAAINVTAKWTGKPDVSAALDDLKYWWQRVGTEAHDLEDGLLRFEAYRVIDEDALVIHEVFATNDDLKFHLSKGTAEKYKKDIDEIAVPECYFFRGPVSWTIRTYSKFLRLPATYSSQGSNYTRPGGTMSDGTILSEGA
jgi:quinol monooxygenase YgiN